MSSSTPPRKFAPTPIEQTTKSSRQPEPQQEKKKVRRFAPEPIEETTRSSKVARQQSPEPEKAKPKPRRFAPEVVEHTTSSSKDVHMKHGEDEKTLKPRRFAPQMVEETHTSSKDKTQAQKPHVKFMPEPISTTYGSNRKKKGSQDSESSAMDVDQTGPRKFTPILLDTARRSRRAGDGNLGVAPADKTEYAYHVHDNAHWKRVNNERSGPVALPPPASESVDSDYASEMSTDDVPQLREPSPMDGSAPKRASCFVPPTRQHSFRMPDLDTIASSESEPDRPPSPSSSSGGHDGSPITAPASEFSLEHFKHATRIRESIDENFSQYLLALESKKARQRLEEQALAAYPNPDFSYEAPTHYITNDDDSEEAEIEDRVVTWQGNDDDDDLHDMPRPRRDSTGGAWELAELQQHAVQMQQERNAAKTTAKQTQGPWWKPPVPEGQDAAEPNSEIKSMRDRARPPMLGGDIVFPRCPSPEPARFDVTQGAAALRNQMSSNAANQERKQTEEDGGLWASTGIASPVSMTKSPVSSNASPTQAKGLWGGFCVNDGERHTATAGGLAPPGGPTGLMTPRVERRDPFALAFQGEGQDGIATPSTPVGKPKAPDIAQINAVLNSERDFEEMMEREYPDSFVTQVYNYLSLGYPSLAWAFDEELAKISRFSIDELRQDDAAAKAAPRGYIRLGPDFEGGGGDGFNGDGCVRWRALKLYVREWARQEKNMAKSDGPGGNWGTGARRGSWAI